MAEAVHEKANPQPSLIDVTHEEQMQRAGQTTVRKLDVQRLKRSSSENISDLLEMTNHSKDLVKHGDREHAPYSALSADRNLVCFD